ncbi:hypothetical protein IE984_02295 [Klebsiella pneumoniae]|nr:hypothetical protein [Klebsiella pneumoniae]
MVLHSTRWLALSYFTYFLATVFFCPSERLAGRKRADSGNHRHFAWRRSGGPFSRQSADCPAGERSSRLITALRVLALLTLLFALAFWAGSHVAWLLAIIIGFNLFFRRWCR